MLRFLQYSGAHGFVQLQRSFSHAGHLCLVLQLLTPCLLDCIASAADLAPAQRTQQLRSIACQLLVSPAVQFATLPKP